MSFNSLKGAHRLGPLLGHLILGVHGAAVQRGVGEVRAERRDPLRVLVDHVARRMVPARRQGGQLTVIDSIYKCKPIPSPKGCIALKLFDCPSRQDARVRMGRRWPTESLGEMAPVLAVTRSISLRALLSFLLSSVSSSTTNGPFKMTFLILSGKR